MKPALNTAHDPAAILGRLRDLLSREPGLAEDVRKAGSPDAAAETLARIGALRGIATDAAELRTHVTRLMAVQRPGPISDDALDAVAAGIGLQGDAAWIAVLNALLPVRDRQ